MIIFKTKKHKSTKKYVHTRIKLRHKFILRRKKPMVLGSCMWNAPKIFVCALMRRTRPYTRTYLVPHEQIYAEYDAQRKFLLVWTRV